LSGQRSGGLAADQMLVDQVLGIPQRSQHVRVDGQNRTVIPGEHSADTRCLSQPGRASDHQEAASLRVPLPTYLTNWSISSISLSLCRNSPSSCVPFKMSNAYAFRIWNVLVGLEGVYWSS